MPTIAELKASSPAYAGMSDDEFAQRVYDKHYAGKMSFDDFAAKVEMAPKPAGPKKTAAELTGISEEDLNPTTGMSFGRKFLSGMGASVDSSIKGVQQLGYMAADQIPGVDLSQQRDQIQSEIDTAKVRDRPLMDTGAGLAGNIAGYGLQIAGPGVAASGTRLAGAVLPTTFRGAAAQGAALGTLQPVASDESRMANAGMGAVAGIGGKAAGDALGAMGSRAAAAIDPVKRASARVAQRAGIPLHASQVSDSIPAKTAASMGKYFPFSGARGAAQRQQAAFNRAVSKTFGADSEQLTDDVIQNARQKIGQEFDAIYARNDVPIDPNTVRRLVALETSLNRRLTTDEAKVLSGQLDDILQEAAGTGSMTGQKYQALRTQIMKAESPDRIGFAVKELRQELDNIAAQAVGPQDAAALKVARGQWANLKTTEGILKQVAGAGGDVRPSAIWPAIRKGSTKEMRELGRLGQVLLKDPIPDSGTAGRNVLVGLMTGGGMAGGVGALGPMAAGAAAGATVGRVANSNALANMMLRPNVGATRKMAGNALNRLAIPAFPAAKGALYDADLEVMGGGGTQPVTEAELEQLRAEMRARRAKAGSQ